MNNPLDHILYSAPTLAEGMDDIERLLGVRPVIGGRHPDFGTHNALLSLGPATYLEVIARDPELSPPPKGLLVDPPAGTPGRLITWVLRAPEIEETAAAAKLAGFDLGGVEAGQRETPAGDVVRWRLTDPYADRLGGALPFLIDWGDTPHPGSVTPAGGQFVSLVIEHPEPGSVRSALAAIASDIEVRERPSFGLTAMIETSSGLVELR